MADIYTITIETRYSKFKETMSVEASSISDAFEKCKEELVEKGYIQSEEL